MVLDDGERLHLDILCGFSSCCQTGMPHFQVDSEAGGKPVLSCHCPHDCLRGPQSTEGGDDDPYEIYKHKVKPEVKCLRPSVHPACRDFNYQLPKAMSSFSTGWRTALQVWQNMT